MEQTITLEVPARFRVGAFGIEVEYSYYGSMTVHQSSTKYVIQKLQSELSARGAKFMNTGNNQFLIVDSQNQSVGLVSVHSNNGFDIFW